MSKIELVSTEQLGMKLRPTGEGIACRYQDSGDESMFIDVLVPSRARAADGTPKRLAAPGTGDEECLATLSMRTVTFSEAHAPFEARYRHLPERSTRRRRRGETSIRRRRLSRSRRKST